MSIANKISKGKWYANDHFIRTDGKTGTLGQAFVVEVPCHENKFKQDVEGQSNAQLFAASKEMYLLLIKIRQEFINSGGRPDEWMTKRLNEIESLFEKHDLIT